MLGVPEGARIAPRQTGRLLFAVDRHDAITARVEIEARRAPRSGKGHDGLSESSQHLTAIAFHVGEPLHCDVMMSNDWLRSAEDLPPRGLATSSSVSSLPN